VSLSCRSSGWVLSHNFFNRKIFARSSASSFLSMEPSSIPLWLFIRPQKILHIFEYYFALQNNRKETKKEGKLYFIATVAVGMLTLALASIHQPIGGHTPALHQHNSALWVAFSAKPNRRLYCQSHVYTTNIDCGNACRQPLPMPILLLAVPGQMPKCTGCWCQFVIIIIIIIIVASLPAGYIALSCRRAVGSSRVWFFPSPSSSSGASPARQASR
jgi:hypothetical protein